MRKFGLCLVITVLTLSAYWQVNGFDFLNYDDPAYVSDNEQVKGGLSLAGFRWAVTATQASNWHPVTWLSHMLDVSLFGPHPGRHHLVNLVIHCANALLLFLLFSGLASTLWPAAFLAAAFAVHPLHVESVAWVSERKDVLSTLFLLLTIFSYARYARQGGSLPYLATVGLFAMGLMAKPMLVTLPFALLLLDYWPLCRIGDGVRADCQGKKITLSAAMLEKIPFFLLAAAVALITLAVQGKAGAIKPLAAIPLSARIDNAIVAYARYLGKMVWPRDLAILYPHPRTIPLWQVGLAAGVLFGISALVFRYDRQVKALTTGWLWYLLTLLPVIGLVQVGTQAMADRYAYIPSIGLLIMAAYGLPVCCERWQGSRKVLAGLSLAALAGWTMLTYWQLPHWRDSESLFRQALQVTEDNFVAHNYLGSALAEQDKAAEAEGHFREALRIYPDYVESLANLGVLCAKRQDNEEAEALFRKALRVAPRDPKLHNNLGNVFKNAMKYHGAALHYQRAADIDPSYAEALANWAAIHERQGSLPEAEALYLKALQRKPGLAEAHNGLGVVRARRGLWAEAITDFERALQLRPDYRPAQENLRRALSQRNR